MPFSPICTVRLIVPNGIGLHARPATMLVKTAQKYDAEIMIKCGRRSVNAKSIMGILTLGAGQGATVTVTADGHDAREAIQAIVELFSCAFHEKNTADEPHVSATGKHRHEVAYSAALSAVPG